MSILQEVAIRKRHPLSEENGFSIGTTRSYTLGIRVNGNVKGKPRPTVDEYGYNKKNINTFTSNAQEMSLLNSDDPRFDGTISFKD